MAVALCNASYDSARLTFLRAVCAVTEGIAAVTASPTVTAAALRDPRVCVLGGREGLPRSLGSVYAGSITRFLGGLRGVAVRRIFNRWDLAIETIAVSHDGAKLWAASRDHHKIHAFRVSDRKLLRTVGCEGRGELEFDDPCSVRAAATDDTVLVVETGNRRVQLLTAQLDFCGFVGDGTLVSPSDACANDAVVAVLDFPFHICLYSRRTGVFLHRFSGAPGSQMVSLMSMCFLRDELAMVDFVHDRIAVFSIHGVLRCHLGGGILKYPHRIACTKFDELVVVSNHFLSVLSASGDLLRTVKLRGLNDVALHNGAVYALTSTKCLCVV
jgi:hypothetical protein